LGGEKGKECVRQQTTPFFVDKRQLFAGNLITIAQKLMIFFAFF
jgi:hypothetical protein